MIRDPHIAGMPHDPYPATPAPLGFVEPHAGLLQRPRAGQQLYKVMSVGNLISSIEGDYLHFNRVNSYKDFPDADRHDGQQLQADLVGNEAVTLAKAPGFSLADYYDGSRSRTYAFCASLEDSDHIWTYGSSTPKGNVGLVLDFDKLRATLNRTLQSGDGALDYNGIRCRQIFSLNYGVVEYIDWASHRANETRLPNPITYTYMKDQGRFAKERELRISLSALGIGKFVLDDLTEIEFPPHLHLGLDFKTAFIEGTVRQIICGPRCDVDFLRSELRRLAADRAPLGPPW